MICVAKALQLALVNGELIPFILLFAASLALFLALLAGGDAGTIGDEGNVRSIIVNAH